MEFIKSDIEFVRDYLVSLVDFEVRYGAECYISIDVTGKGYDSVKAFLDNGNAGLKCIDNSWILDSQKNNYEHFDGHLCFIFLGYAFAVTRTIKNEPTKI